MDSRAPDSEMVGRRLSRYRILENLGAGGMGQVFRARDERLERDVALKILPSGLLEDEEARRRFKKESRTLCRVIHPHVATLLDSASADGIDFLVMELVAGPTLHDRIWEGRFEEKEVLRLTTQLALGLQAAHDLGVVHRDIKPSNLALTSDGLLKILDFGLARLLPRRSACHDEGSQTTTSAGMVAGSPPYMPPEQLLGRPVDPRSDLYAVGAVMYEMVTRRRVFDGLHGAELTDAVLHLPPRPPSEVGGRLSPGLEAVILKLLDKDPRLRYQSVRELLVDLERLERGLEAGTPIPTPASSPRVLPTPGPWWRRVLGIVAVLAIGALATSWLLITDEGGDPGAGRAADLAAPATVTPLTSAPGLELHPALSPSGRRLAYVAGGEGESNTEVYVQDVGSHQAVSITTSGLPECCVAWMPDERDLVFVRLTRDRGVIIGVGAGGGIEKPLAELTPWFGTALSVSPDGRTLAYSDRATPDEPFSVVLLSVETLQARTLTSPSPGELGDAFPAFSPDGEWVAFARITTGFHVADVYAVRSSGGEPQRLTSRGQFVGHLQWASAGRNILFWMERPDGVSRMWRIDLEGGAPVLHWPRGDPVNPQPFSNGEAMITSVNGSFRFSVARESGQVALTRSTYDTDVWEVPIAGNAAPDPDGRPLITSTQTDESPQYSPDGTRIAFASLRSGNPQVWICDRSATRCDPLLAASAEDGTPRWSPDGGRIALDARPEGRSDVFVVDVETRAVKRLTEHEADDVVPSWSRDGEWVYFASRRRGSWQVFKVPQSGGDAQQVTTNGGFAAFESPTDDRLLYTRFGSPGLWAVPLSGGAEVQLLDEPRCWGHWAVGPGAVYVAASPPGQLPRLLKLEPSSGQTESLFAIPRRLPCGESALAVSPDGQHLLFAGIREASDVVLVVEQPGRPGP